MDNLPDRILNPGVIITMVAAGLAYAHFLWAFNLRPTATLAIVAIGPGLIFLLTVWAIRAAQGTPSLIWPFLIFDWLVFSITGVLTVLIARRRHHK